MSDNTRTLMSILAGVAFVVSMFLGALTAPAVLTGLRGIWAGALSGTPNAIALLGLLIAVVGIALLRFRTSWARIVLAIAVGLVLGSLAPPMTGGAA
ncbi:hypothetical protein PARPLA_01646 [Rhodobacteraceae bacterium THAF1]|uniref:hypothetical protein n=1 Tax=Palleronia sp. THAF1 TaxID=2587842 RepID=UPI000F3BAED4|nr:hypothetical protein [Palleronia sp. THAF1]QFU07730.1 hypothetical protein FIU81_03475 [Palleronia sp. THAF1]VDC23211.1 hypothetical protein PARPLA_01646 [Rhodobacteraceae bacterium THAF1]